MLTWRGFIAINISALIFILSIRHSSFTLLFLGGTLLLYLLYCFAQLYLSSFSNRNTELFCKSFVYVSEKVTLRASVDLKEESYFKLLYDFPSYVHYHRKTKENTFLQKGFFEVEVSFKKEGRYFLPVPKLIAYDRAQFFYRKLSISSDRMIFVKEKKPPYIADDQKALANLSRIGTIKSKQGLGDHDFKQLRNYVLVMILEKLNGKVQLNTVL